MRRALLALLCACGQVDAGTPATSVTGTFALHDFFVGDTTRDGETSPSAWKSFGRNIDGRVTDANSTDVCTLASGAPRANQADGEDGIDNAFGAVFVPNMRGDVGPAESVQMTQAMQAGKWSLQIQVTGLSNDPTQTSTGLVARAFDAAPLDAPPAFDDTTSWPVSSSSLTDGATIAGGALATFPDATITNGVFDSGPSMGPLHFTLSTNGTVVPLVLHTPRITFTHAARTDAIDGTLSGVLDVQELLATVGAIASHISPQLCGDGFYGIGAQISEAADILHDGTNAPGVPCDGISVGFGFDAKLIANPTEVVPAAPLVNACP